jgi:predicted PurR-regulated permease PerM
LRDRTSVVAARVKPRAAAPRKDTDTGRDNREKLPLDPKARLAARVVLALLIFAASLWTAAEFLPALIWAAIIAVAAWPLYTRCAVLVPKVPPTLTAMLFTLLIGALLFLPIALATWQIAQQSDSLFGWIKQSQESGIPIPDWIARLPIAAEAAQQWWRDNLAEPRAAAAWLQSLNAEKAGELVKTFGGQLLHRAFMFFVALLALFVMLRNGYGIARRVLETADTLFGDPGEGLAGKMVDAVRGTVNGTIMVAVAEGLLIGSAYLAAGVPNPLLFTVLTIAFAMVPFGAWVAFTAAALTLAFGGGSTLAALAVFGWGAAVMLTGDHFVWPTLVGGAARLPFLFAFVGIFGGLATFGLLGLFLGPVVMAALLTVWREWIIAQSGNH